MAGRASGRLGLLVVTIGLAAVLGLAGPSPTVGACSAAPIPFERVVERAEQVFLVTVAQLSGLLWLIGSPLLRLKELPEAPD